MEKGTDNFDIGMLELYVQWTESLEHRIVDFTNGLAKDSSDEKVFAIFKGFKPWRNGLDLDDGDYLTMRCGLTGIYTCVNTLKSGKWMAECLDGSATIAYRKFNKNEEFESFIKPNKDVSQLKTERNQLIESLHRYEKEKEFLVSKASVIKEKIRDNTNEYVQKFVRIFEPGSSWKIHRDDYNEYFCVHRCTVDDYTYREEDVDDTKIRIWCSYFCIKTGDTPVNTQFTTEKTICLRIKEIPFVQEIKPSEWNAALTKLFTTIQIEHD